MKRIKGIYRATLEIIIDCKENEDTFPFEQIKNNIENGRLTQEIQKYVGNEFVFEDGYATIKQEYANIEEIEV